ncbi:MAG: HDOD domain-containing protein [Aquabacterium sp.]|jgi:HD-like signal output (HDOD) protein|nr:MAG: HDOD domain-containing protein [Aquabacterium sp.]
MRLEALFKQPQALPTVPKIVHELIESFNKEDISIEDVARKLAADPVLSARLLRLANSAYYHVSRAIGTVDDALAMLGFVTVRTLVISSGLTNGFKAMPGLDLNKFWHYSLNTAAASRWLSKLVGGNGDLAFTVGLMHGIGQLVMHAGMPEQMLPIDKIASSTDPRRLDIESASFGYNFADVGAELAKQWKFPPAFADAIAGFPNPLERNPFDPMAAVLHLAAWRARAEENGLNADELAGTLPTAVAAKLSLSADVLLKQMPPLAELSAGLEALVN